MGDTLELTGNLVGLRRLRVSDVGPHYLSWLTTPEVNAFLEARFSEHTLESLREFVEMTGSRPDTLLLAIVELETMSHVGNVKVGPLDPHHGTADLGILVGERRCWGRGYGTEAIRLAARLAFEQLGARKLTASCYSANAGSAAAFRRAGWIEEGLRFGQFLADDGTPNDQLLFGLFRSPC